MQVSTIFAIKVGFNTLLAVWLPNIVYSLIAIGLSWQLALAAVAIGNFITALVVTFNVRGSISIQIQNLTRWTGNNWSETTYPFYHSS